MVKYVTLTELCASLSNVKYGTHKNIIDEREMQYYWKRCPQSAGPTILSYYHHIAIALLYECIIILILHCHVLQHAKHDTQRCTTSQQP